MTGNASPTAYNSWQQKQLEFSWLWSVGLGATAFLTATANLFVMVAVSKDPNRNLRRAPSNLLIASQAMADFFVGVALEPACIQWFATFQDAAEVVIEALTSLFSVASIFHMLALSYDRYVAVVTPMHYAARMTTRRVYITIVIIWSYSAVYMGYRTLLRIVCHVYIALNIIAGLHTVFPAFLGLVLYARLYSVIRVHRKHADSLDESGRAVMQAYRRQRKMTLVFLAALLLFLVCMTPWFVFYQVIDACPSCRGHKEVQMYLFCFFFYLFMVKSLLNPFLYAWRLSKYRAAFHRLLPWCRIPARKIGEGSETASQSADGNMNSREKSIRVYPTMK